MRPCVAAGRTGFNEAAARRRRKAALVMPDLPSSCRFNEAAARRRRKVLERLQARSRFRPGFNEAAARRRRKGVYESGGGLELLGLQ